MSTENIEVIPLGEDGDLWFVTGTRDAHSAWEAAEAYDIAECEGWGCSQLEGMDPDLVSLKYRTDWGWKHPEGWPPEREPEDDSRLVHGEQDPRMPRFAGFLVSA